MNFKNRLHEEALRERKSSIFPFQKKFEPGRVSLRAIASPNLRVDDAIGPPRVTRN